VTGPVEDGTGDDHDRGIVAVLADGVVVVDGGGRIRFANPAACELFGRPLSSLLGVHFGYPFTVGVTTEIELRVGTIPRVVEMRTRSSTWNGEAMMVASLRDVTARATAVTELEAALNDHEAALAVASHELKNSNAIVLGFAETLVAEWDQLDEAKRFHLAERIEVNLRGMQRMVANLLSTASMHALVPRAEAFDVAGLVATTIGALGKETAEVSVVCPPGVVAYADPDQVGEILANLLGNAFKYGAPPIQVVVRPGRDTVELRVCDHGPGVAPEFVPRLFERFSRAPTVGRLPGVGLGLSIVAALAGANNGAAWYEAAPGDGACFCVRVPLAETPGS